MYSIFWTKQLLSVQKLLHMHELVNYVQIQGS